jgi:hypothetical protein
MVVDRGIVEFIYEGGSGSEANVRVELRTEFPGIGGTIITREGVVAALREEYVLSPKSGHRMFIRHTIIKKLDDYFYRKGVYVYAHVPRPLGSISRVGKEPYEAYLYEWAYGLEGFPWEWTDHEGNRRPIKLRDWESFVEHFRRAGIDLAKDCTSSDDAAISQNIIHQYPNLIVGSLEMSSLWKRIDFGYLSISIDFDKLLRFLHDNREDLIEVLRSERYEMLLLSVEYLTRGEKMREIDIGRLEVLLGEYRRASLTQYAMGSGPGGTPVYFGPRTESLV